MKHELKSPRLAARAALLSLLALAPLAMAQQQTGNLFGKVTDDGGQPLPGVSVSLTGVGAPQNAVTNASGEYRFVNVSPGTYTVRHELSGFSAVTRPNVVVTVGKNTDLPIAMRLSNVEAAVTVDGGAPLLDTRKISTGASISQLELQSIPTARDPWVVLSSVPGVLMDRANVGGNESGQQSSYVAKGSSGNASTWNVDGVNVTDVGAVGSSPTYYDFDSFQEMQAATGGSDITLMTAGANLNMVTKRGSNDTKGSGRVFVTDKRFQSDSSNDEATAQGFSRGNRIDDIQDFGLEAGGAIVKDHLWLWGSYGRNQINLRTPATAANPDGFSDKTTLEDLNFKLNAQLMDSNSATLFYLRGDKIKLGRNADITRPQETTWDQKGPTSVYKIEDSHIFSANVFATALYSHIDSGFGFTPQGGASPYAYRSPDGVNHGTYFFYESVRPQRQASGNLSVFANTGSLGHEIKAGFVYRNAPVSSATAWPHGIRGIERAPAANGASRHYVRVYREGNVSYDTKFLSGFLQDTITLSNLTVNLGVRYDTQSGNNKATASPANPSFPDAIPAIAHTNTDKPFEWQNVLPRVGLTYALGKDKRTLLRASYGKFVDNMPGSYTSFINNAQYGYIWYGWTDGNNDHIAQRSEVNFNNILYAYNINPDCPTCPNPNRVNPDLKGPTTQEIVLGFEHELFTGLAVSVNGTYRKMNDLVWFQNFGLNANGSMHLYTRDDFELSDYVEGIDVNGNPYRIPYYGLKATAPGPTGRYLSNRPDYSQEYKGVEFQLNKRYADNWSARFGFSYNDWTQDVGSGAFFDPSNQLNQTVYGSTTGGSIDDGGPVVYNVGVGSGAKGNVYINSKWQMNVNALYTLPWGGLNVAGNFFARQGYPILFIDTNGDPGDGLGPRNLLINPIGTKRNPTVANLDLRLEKPIKIQNITLSLSVDAFNVLNSNVTLQRKTDVSQSANAGGDITEIQSPRVFRFGGRITF